ncbi:MAG: 30S ribosomal protein S20 [Planctomycetes bacterium]|nr:30S ribosomal protein S20 [Planctomycetota bacterium]
MPNTKQAGKRHRQDERRRIANKAKKSMIRTFTKKVEAAIEEGKPADAEELYRIAQKKLDKAAKTNTVHPNKAARRKSRLQKKVNAAKAQAKA